jgi:hypothetical protein
MAPFFHSILADFTLLEANRMRIQCGSGSETLVKNRNFTHCRMYRASRRRADQAIFFRIFSCTVFFEGPAGKGPYLFGGSDGGKNARKNPGATA